MVQADLVSLIGAISGLVSIVVLIYIAGYKLGKIDKTLDDLKGLPKEIGKLMARVDVLWEHFISSLRGGSCDLSSQDASKGITDFAKKLGLTIKSLELYRSVPK
ncbi:MAG: hypothetical protein AOA65_2224 [Candidatus Bathyarchaeota archaeon BA1]|nr:MAG: hypothetical protein AOA65_2224 [Candidatus Bathyarchaeota archaeon BA1]